MRGTGCIARRAGVGALVLALWSGTLLVGARPGGAGAGPPFLLLSANSSKALDVPGRAQEPGVQFVQWAPHGGENQQWIALPFGNDVFALFTLNRQGFVLDVAGASAADGAPVVQFPWHGGLNQLWLSVPFGETNDVVLFVSLASGKVLDVSAASTANGAPIVQWTWHGGANQLWFGHTLPGPA